MDFDKTLLSHSERRNCFPTTTNTGSSTHSAAEEAVTAISSTIFLPNLEDKGEELHKAEKAATAEEAVTAISSTIFLPNLNQSHTIPTLAREPGAEQ